MKKLVLNISFVLIMSICVSSLVELVLVFSFGRGINVKIDGHSHTYSRLFEADTTSKNYEYLAIGSSHCYRSLITDSINMFNLGSSAQSHFQTYLITKEYLEKINPKVVIYEIYPDIFYGNLHLESQIDVNYAVRNFRSIKHLLAHTSFRNVRSIVNSSMLDVFDLKNSAAFASRSKDSVNIYVAGGYVRRLDSLTGLSCTDHEQVILADFDSKQIEYFMETIKFLRKNNVSIRLVIAPYTHIPSNMGEYTSFIENLTGLPVENYSNRFCDSPENYFFDEGHLNATGARLFTKIVMNNL